MLAIVPVHSYDANGDDVLEYILEVPEDLAIEETSAPERPGTSLIVAGNTEKKVTRNVERLLAEQGLDNLRPSALGWRIAKLKRNGTARVEFSGYPQVLRRLSWGPRWSPPAAITSGRSDMAHVREVERKGGTAFEVRWRAATGKFQQKTFTGKRDAERFALKVENELADGNSTEPLVKNGKTFRERGDIGHLRRSPRQRAALGTTGDSPGREPLNERHRQHHGCLSLSWRTRGVAGLPCVAVVLPCPQRLGHAQHDLLRRVSLVFPSQLKLPVALLAHLSDDSAERCILVLWANDWNRGSLYCLDGFGVGPLRIGIDAERGMPRFR